jgi:hypothetical protein
VNAASASLSRSGCEAVKGPDSAPVARVEPTLDLVVHRSTKLRWICGRQDPRQNRAPAIRLLIDKVAEVDERIEVVARQAPPTHDLTDVDRIAGTRAETQRSLVQWVTERDGRSPFDERGTIANGLAPLDTNRSACRCRTFATVVV